MLLHIFCRPLFRKFPKAIYNIRWVSQDSSDLVRITITNAEAQNVEMVWVPDVATDERPLPATLPNVYEGCSSPRDNSITWTFF